MNNKWWICLVFLIGCQSNKVEEKIDLPIPPPLPKHFLPPTPPPNFTPSILDLDKIQINSVPHPLHLGQPYAIWVNKRRVNIGIIKLNELMILLDLPTKPPKNTAELHSGKGWLFPFNIDE
jgi:hypothetical protein